MMKQELIDFEADLARRWEAGDIKCPLHLSGGNEDQLIEIFKEIGHDDYVFSSHRNHYHALLSGSDPKRLLSEILGYKEGVCQGRARSMGYIDHSVRFYSSAIVGGCCAMAVGVAWALKASGSDRKVWCFVGDGAVDGGHFWEAYQYAEGWELPITFVAEYNNQATCTPIKDRLGKGHIIPTYYTNGTSRLRGYSYKPTYPHVGSGVYVQF